MSQTIILDFLHRGGGGTGVCLFLILSGYGLSRSYAKSGLRQFWQKRLLAVFVPYWIVQAVSYPFAGGVGIAGAVLDCALIKPLHPLGWYLNYLLLWYVTFFAVHLIKSEKARRAAFIGISVAYACFFEVHSPIRFEQSLSFVTGCIFARESKSPLRLRAWYVVVLFFTATLLLFIKQLGIVRSSDVAVNFLNLALKYFYAVAILFTVLLLGEKRCGCEGKVLAFLGSVSYEAYLVHGYTLRFFDVTESALLAIPLFALTTVAGIFVLFFVVNRLARNMYSARILR